MKFFRSCRRHSQCVSDHTALISQIYLGLNRQYSPEVMAALQSVQFIAQHIKDEDKDNEVIEDWKYVAMVLDRLFLWIFTLACIGGTCGIIFQAPSLYDTRSPIDQQLSEIFVLRSSGQNARSPFKTGA
ncbi:unnamed protein product [Allacma fusca]|uniref:Neurotransmitter-gated ion-channel transmembrane domain-containing protein n=1 Tax=Allacma fusca TaxID=39272 RepID=A0A8J2P336_9HEXA|nr:unnamed protein product [Allacma fusca]